MDWHGNFRTFVSRPETSFNFLCNYNHNPGMDVKHATMVETQQGLVPIMDKMSYGNQEKKKRLTTDQLESLERSFQEEIKLDPDKKMKLSRDLGLQPRQIAVWFQNRRARWKAKQLELLYDSLKQEFDLVSKEKQNLQDELMKLKAMLRREQAFGKQASIEISGEETEESTSVTIRSSSGKPRGAAYQNHQIGESNYLVNVEEYNPVTSPYWGVIPSYP